VGTARHERSTPDPSAESFMDNDMSRITTASQRTSSDKISDVKGRPGAQRRGRLTLGLVEPDDAAHLPTHHGHDFHKDWNYTIRPRDTP
jgi:hypothetical protein